MLLGNSIKGYLTIREFAEKHGASEEAVSAKVYRGTIDYYRLGSGRRTFILIPENAELKNAKPGPKTKVDRESKEAN